MTYGLTILNADGRTQIDERYSQLYPVSETAGYGTNTAYPPTGFASGDLVIARPAVSSTDKVRKTSSFPGATSTSLYWHLLRKFDGNITPPTSGYDLVVRGPSGTSYFVGKNNAKMFEVVAVGEILMTTSPGAVKWPSPSTTVSDLDKYWVVINNTYYLAVALFTPGVPSAYWAFDYTYEWTSGTTGRISINHYYSGGGGSLPTASYMILKELP